MHIRCKSCHTAVWVDPPESAHRAALAACKLCGQQYRLQGERSTERIRRTLARNARKLAGAEAVNLPGAYSILLGAMTLEEVRRIRTTSAPTATIPPAVEAAVPATGAEPGRLRMPYDPAFESAVTSGLLTVLEAAQRGQRSGYAGILASRHHLPLAVAFDVADNKLPLLVALRQNVKAGAVPIELTFKVASNFAFVWMLAGIAAIAALVFVVRPSIPVAVTPHADTTRVVLGAEVRTDARGRVVSVSGPDPRTVLAAYCAADHGQGFEPLGLVPPPRGGTGKRLGLLRRKGSADTLLAFEIREDRANERWIAGSGAAPIVAGPAPPGAASGIRRQPSAAAEE